MAPSTGSVLAAVRSAGIRYELEAGWDDRALAAGGTWQPAYVVMHHTANGGAKGNAPSLAHICRGTYPPVRNAHFLVARDGLVYLTFALKCYHAGDGGPGRWGDGPSVPLDAMNGYAYGIEIESRGTSTDTAAHGGTDGITSAQYDAASRLAAALLDMLGRSTGCAINHRTWAPERKVDTLDSDRSWHDRIDRVRHGVPDVGEDDDMPLIFRTHGSGQPDGTYAGGAHYLVLGTHAVQLAAGYRADPDIPTVDSPSEKGDESFYDACTMHYLP